MALPSTSIPYKIDWQGANPFAAGQLQYEQRREQELKNQFFPQTAMADVLSKTAYANWAPIQPLAQILANPAVWQSLPQERLQEMTAVLSNALQRPLNYAQGVSGGAQGQPNFGGTQLQSPEAIAQAFGGQKVGGGQSSPMQSIAGGERAMPELPAPQGSGIQAPGAIREGTVSPRGALPNTPAFNAASGNIIPGSPGGLNAKDSAEAQANFLKTLTQQQAEYEGAGWNKAKAEHVAVAENAANALNELKNIHESFGHLPEWQKGPVGGLIPALTTDAQLIEKSQEILRNAVVEANSKGVITASQRRDALAAVPGRKLNDEAERAFFNNLSGIQQRSQERIGFDSDVEKALPWTTHAERDKIWQRYIQERPFYNPKTHSLIGQNLGKYTDYLDPSVAAQIIRNEKPKEQKPKDDPLGLF